MEKLNAQFLEAVWGGDLALTRRLLAEGANVETCNEFGENALRIAAQDGNLECVRLLVQHGACLDTRNEQGVTALHTAAIFKALGCVKFLLGKLFSLFYGIILTVEILVDYILYIQELSVTSSTIRQLQYVFRRLANTYIPELPVIYCITIRRFQNVFLRLNNTYVLEFLVAYCTISRF